MKYESKLAIPTQCCVLAHVTTTLDLIRKGAPIDLVFQSIAGTEAANKSFGINLAILREAHDAALSLRPRHGRPQCDVFRDRPGQRTLGRRASRRRPADARGARICRCAPIQAALGQHGRRLHRPGIPVQRQANHPRRPRRSFLRQAAGRADGLATSATPTMPKPTRTTWTRC